MASALPTRLANGLANSGLDGLGEDVPDAGNLLAENVRIYPQSDGRVSVAEASSNHVDWDPGEQQSSGVEVAQVVQPAVVGPCGSGGLTFSRLPTVMFAEHRHGFRIDADGPGDRPPLVVPSMRCLCTTAVDPPSQLMRDRSSSVEVRHLPAVTQADCHVVNARTSMRQDIRGCLLTPLTCAGVSP